MAKIYTLNTYRQKVLHWIGILLLSIFAQQYSSAATENTQIISNMAIGEYTEVGSTVVQVSRSNLVQTTIIPVYSFNLTADGSKTAVAGQTIYFPHTLTNTGNDVDQYNLAVVNNIGDDYDLNNLAVYLDANNDGLPDGDPISSYALSTGESVGLVVGVIIPATTSVGLVATTTLTATSQNGAGSNSNTDTVTVTDKSALDVRKRFSVAQTSTGSVVTVRIDYRNYGNTATGEVTLTDTLDANLSYQTGGENWNSLIVDPATGSNDPVGIDYSVTSNVVTAVLTSIPANTAGYIEFNVIVNRSIAGGVDNIVNVQNDHDNNPSTAIVVDTSNTAVVEVATLYGVEINGISSSASGAAADNLVTASAMQGGEVSFTNYVWNTGNTTDRYNLILTNNTFPAGSQIEFYRADGITPLLDTNGDSIPDTGILAAGEKLQIVVKVRFPNNYADITSTNYSVFPQAQSINDPSKVDTVEDQASLLVTTPGFLVDLANSPELSGLGNSNIDNAGAAWKTLTASSSAGQIAGGQVVFPLVISHTGTATEYLLSADADGDFSQIELPAGVNAVRFYQSSNGTNCSTLGAEIGKTQYLDDGDTQLVCAVVEVDKVAETTTVPIYFNVSSTSVVSSNNNSNPGRDTIKDAITIQSVSSVAQVEFMPDLKGRVAPLGSIVYSHLLINHGDTALTGDHNFVISNDNADFTATIYYDSNNDGQLDAGDIAISSIADLPGGELAAQGQVRLFVKVTNTSATNIAQTNITTVNLQNSTTLDIIDSVTDVTTVNQTQLNLSKLQARDDNCDGNADTAYTMNNLTIGRQANGQGQCVLYKVILTNQGSTTINSTFTFRDQTPDYTVMFQSPTCASCSAVSGPSIGQEGSVTGTLDSVVSGQSYEFSFGVRYVE